MELNVNAVFRLSRAAARGMIRRKYGRIVNIGNSIAGARSIASPVHYATSKAALEGMTRALAHQLRPLRHPRQLHRGPGSSRGASAGPSPSTTRSATSTRARSAGSDKPAECGELVAWLGSSRNSYVNGAVVILDGGTVA